MSVTIAKLTDGCIDVQIGNCERSSSGETLFKTKEMSATVMRCNISNGPNYQRPRLIITNFNPHWSITFDDHDISEEIMKKDRDQWSLEATRIAFSMLTEAGLMGKFISTLAHAARESGRRMGMEERTAQIREILGY